MLTLVVLTLLSHQAHDAAAPGGPAGALPSGASGVAAPSAAAADDDDFGDAEPAQVAPSEAATEAGKPTGPVAFVGYFHSAAVHMPIAWLLLLVLVDVLTFFLHRDALRPVGYGLLGLTAAAFVPGILTGLARIQTHLEDPEALFHRNIMFSAFAMLCVALILRVIGKNQLAGAKRAAYLGFLLVALGLTLLGGHEGGELIFGDPPSF